jgi:hypothetical protein
MPPCLDDIDEISGYILSHPVDALQDEELISELGHWKTLCSTHLWREVRRPKGNPISKANVIRLGALFIEVVSVPFHIIFPPAGLVLNIAGLGFGLYNEAIEFNERRRQRMFEATISLIHQRYLDLQATLDARSTRPPIS